MIMIDIEMPEKCGECPCFHAEYPMYCQLIKPPDKNKQLAAPYGLPRPDWCPIFKAEPLVKPSDTLELLKGIRKRISEAAIESRKWYGDETMPSLMPAFAYWKAIRTALKEIDIEIEKRERYE